MLRTSPLSWGTKVEAREFLAWRCNRFWACRQGPWKCVGVIRARTELFNLDDDPSESVDLGFAFPSGGQGEAKSGGTYDYRGPKCMEALRDVILFAMGKIADAQGQEIQDILGDIHVLTSNVGVRARKVEMIQPFVSPGKMGGPLDKLQFWTHKPAYYGDTGGRVQNATSTEVNVRGQEMRRSSRIRQMPADQRPPW